MRGIAVLGGSSHCRGGDRSGGPDRSDAGGTGPISPRSSASLIEAERAFSKTSEEKGIREAFLTWLAPDAIVFRPAPVEGRPVYEKMDPADPAVLTWEPEFAEIASSGELGYTTGPYRIKPGPRAPSRPASVTMFPFGSGSPTGRGGSSWISASSTALPRPRPGRRRQPLPRCRPRPSPSRRTRSGTSNTPSASCGDVRKRGRPEGICKEHWRVRHRECPGICGPGLIPGRRLGRGQERSSPLTKGKADRKRPGPEPAEDVVQSGDGLGGRHRLHLWDRRLRADRGAGKVGLIPQDLAPGRDRRLQGLPGYPAAGPARGGELTISPS